MSAEYVMQHAKCQSVPLLVGILLQGFSVILTNLSTQSAY